jgi:glycerate kinase
VRVLVAPDKFKGTLSAPEAAEAIARGWVRGDPRAEPVLVPMADGGEGTLDVLIEALAGTEVSLRVTGPLGDPVDARYGLVTVGGRPTAVVEMAAASGLGLVPADRRDPTITSTRGTGELILAAARAGAERILVAVGGSGTNDGGAGMAQALGVRLLDDRGQELGPGGGELLSLDRIDARGLVPALRGAEVVVATDVDNPLLGSHGASAVYGPQKGATPGDVQLLDRALGRFARIAARDLGVDVAELPGAGAAGGLGAGLVAFLGASLVRGADVVAEAVDLERRIESADAVVTGEGSFDAQSLRGKAPGVVVRMAIRAGIRPVVLCGVAEGSDATDGLVVASTADRFGPEAALGRPAETLEALATEVGASLAGRDPMRASTGSGDRTAG